MLDVLPHVGGFVGVEFAHEPEVGAAVPAPVFQADADHDPVPAQHFAR